MITHHTAARCWQNKKILIRQQDLKDDKIANAALFYYRPISQHDEQDSTRKLRWQGMKYLAGAIESTSMDMTSFIKMSIPKQKEQPRGSRLQLMQW